MTEETFTKVATISAHEPTNHTLPPRTGAEASAEPDPLSKRFLNFRTLISFVIGLAILGFVLSRVDVNVADITAKLAQTNLPLFLGALVLYYATFPIRALRWQKLLSNVGYHNGSAAEARGEHRPRRVQHRRMRSGSPPETRRGERAGRERERRAPERRHRPH